MKLAGRLAVIAVFGVATSASAIVISGGPTTTPPGGGSCSVTSGTAPDLAGGVTITCSGLNVGFYRHLYYGINNAPISPNGDSMQSHNPVTGTEVFRYSSNNGSNQITYTGTTSIFNQQSGVTSAVSESNLVAFDLGSGSLVTDATITALNNTNGDVQYLWQVTANSFTTTVNVNASGSNAAPTVFDPTHTTIGAQEIDHVSLAFYFDTCGNGVREGAEQCDNGASNGQPGSCCDANCNFVASGTTCRGVAGPCDVAETCTGGSGACPGNSFLSSTTVCRGSAGVCDAAEKCTGSSAACPGDSLASSTVVCRPASGVCDQAENCTGTSVTCPADGFLSSTTVCRGSAGPCDVAENCTGAGTACPADAFLSSTTVCRSSAGVCDVAETCTGSSAACPANTFQSSTTVCRGSGGVCDVAENCTGSSAGCPADGFAPSTTVCRGSAGVCDVAENCTGSSVDCPGDGVAASTVVCRSPAGECDAAESCDGTGVDCPVDAKDPSGSACTDDGNACTLDECDGSSDTCQHPAGNAGAVCRPAADVCDVAETCDGTSSTCPSDAFASSTVVCRPSAGPCDQPENCTGTGAACPADAFTSAGGAFVCRPAAGPCDVDDTCDGSGAACPADQKSTGVCRPAGGPCDVSESCDGVSNTCPADAKQPPTTVCRLAADQCDVPETCDGSSDACPPNGFAPDGTPCNDNSACTGPDTCVSGVCTGTPDPGGCADHYLCYKTRDAYPWTVIHNVNLDDTFQPNTNFDLLKPVHLCNPATKDNEPILDQNVHERSYKLRPSPGSQRFQKVTNIGTLNTIGSLRVDAIKPDLLFVPAAKNVFSQPPPLGPNNVDHYKCYKTAVTKGTTKFQKGVTALISDQFRNTQGQFDLKKPRHFCTPVSKNTEPVHNPNGYLLCYVAKPSRGVAKQGKVAPVYVHDQFNGWTVATIKEDEFCVPTVRVP